jgi:nicotinamide riboside kinase
MSKRVVEINPDEIAELVRGCDRARDLLAALAEAVAAIDARTRRTRVWLAVMEYRARHAQEVEDEN